MTIYIGADHGGFALKEKLKAALKDEAYDVVDMGAAARVEDDDYPDYATAVAKKIQDDPLNARGIVICRSGFGVDIVANKYDGVRAALATSPEHAYQGRHDDDVNVLALAADFIDEAVAIKAAKVFLITPFAKEDKYSRRLEKIVKIEATN
ncbi:MAG TPA: RpiB/LacA/LacB family sugar-phosphate isomerase [Candidatus Paceibacterota bacterium]|jgi:ribose 5-phosphate isomerase B|nr:RpiB/LacA/LacB family sugar-phosphate isomerase [Candidatus Paceibacterota bacterium]